MKPSVGRIVHYTNLGDADGKYPPETQAALMTGVGERQARPVDQPEPAEEEAKYTVDLHVFYRTGDFFMLDVPFASEPKRGHWSWPPRIG